MAPVFMTVRAFCNAYDVGRTRACELINQGAIEAVKIGRSTLIATASAEVWAATLARVKPKHAARCAMSANPAPRKPMHGRLIRIYDSWRKLRKRFRRGIMKR